MEEVLVMEEKAKEEEITLKFVVVVGRQNIQLIHAIESMTFHLISILKIIAMIRIVLMQIFIMQIQILISKIIKV